MKKVLITLSIFLCIALITTKAIAMTNFQNVGTNTGIVTAEALNIRSGTRFNI